ncbi:MAG: PAS domain-containing sensor histidine kinase [Acidobacteriota bacterium]|nr:PAS domain-containing sensor histidine kinase [Acidobacteriota bacterium]
MNRTTIPLPSFLRGGGDAGALLRSIDWTQTAVGAIDGWSESLKTTVGTLLHSRHPMFLWWGQHLVQFYNDAYLPSFGQGKHPAAMGQPGADCWQEIWPIISPQIDDVMQRATSSWHEDQLVPIFRNGRLEEVYWTYGYSPVFEASGAVGGTLVVCTETTGRVISDRRLRTLRVLVERLVNATAPSAVMDGVVEILAHEDADVPFALLYGITASGEPGLLHSVGLGSEARTSVDAEVGGRLEQLSRHSSVHVLTEPIADRRFRWPEPVDEVFAARIASGDQRTASGYVVFGLSPRSPFDDSYREYLRQLADCIGQANARNEALHLRAVLENERNNLLEQAPVATAVLVGPEHVFLLANPLYRQMVGRADLVGKPYREAFSELVDTPMFTLLDRVYRTGEPFATSEMSMRLDRDGTGELRDCFFTFNLEPMRNATGDVYGMMAVAVEITPIVMARQVLEKGHQEREQLLHELEHANRAKDDFLSVVSHELRTPINAILGWSELLIGTPTSEMTAKAVGAIRRSATHQQRLIEDLLDVSRIASGTLRMTLGVVQLGELLTAIVELVLPQAAAKGVQLDWRFSEQLGTLNGDRDRLQQALSNILVNAVRFTPRDGRVSVEAHPTEEGIAVSVADTGIGINADFLPLVFDRFTRLDRSPQRQGGLGLGLALAKDIVTAHGGTIQARSDGVGRGTTVTVYVPQVPPRGES